MQLCIANLPFLFDLTGLFSVFMKQSFSLSGNNESCRIFSAKNRIKGLPIDKKHLTLPSKRGISSSG